METPIHIPGFVVIREMGSADGSVGGMARVFKARREGDSSDAFRALKVLRQEKAANPDIFKAFYRELDVLPCISSPHVVRIYTEESSRPDQPLQGWHVLSLEWIEGCDLRHLVMDDGPLLAVRAVDILRDLLKALHAVHEAGLVHCDVRPANIRMEAGTNRLVLLDLGIAVSNHEDLSSRIIMGSLGYMSPEHFEPHLLAPSSDLYSAGVVFYFMLTRRTPFNHAGGPDAFIQAAMQHRSQPPPSPRHYNPYISPELEEIMLTALSKKAEDRFQSAGDFLNAIEAVRELEVKDPPEILAPEDEASTGSPETSHRTVLMILGIVGLVAMVLVAGLLLLLLRSRDPPPVIEISDPVVVEPPADNSEALLALALQARYSNLFNQAGHSWTEPGQARQWFGTALALLNEQQDEPWFRDEHRRLRQSYNKMAAQMAARSYDVGRNEWNQAFQFVLVGGNAFLTPSTINALRAKIREIDDPPKTNSAPPVIVSRQDLMNQLTDEASRQWLMRLHDHINDYVPGRTPAINHIIDQIKRQGATNESIYKVLMIDLALKKKDIPAARRELNRLRGRLHESLFDELTESIDAASPP